MGFRVTYKPDYIHVEYLDYVDACDVVTQVNDDSFWERLSKVKKVLFDYSLAKEVSIRREDIKDFAIIARVQADLIGPVDVVTLIPDPNRLENAKHYKANSESPNWRVHITTSQNQADEILSTI